MSSTTFAPGQAITFGYLRFISDRSGVSCMFQTFPAITNIFFTMLYFTNDTLGHIRLTPDVLAASTLEALDISYPIYKTMR
jgi:hypothetical protein